MQKDNQLARIEQYLESIQTPESNNAVILVDSELDEVGASNPDDNVWQNGRNCRNDVASACGTNKLICTNVDGVCGGSTNGGTCINERAENKNYTVGCG